MRCPQCQIDNPSDSKFCKECGTRIPEPSAEFPGRLAESPITPTQELAKGTLFANRYQVLGVLGRGSMGKVYKVLDTKLDAEIALKLIRPEIASDERIIEGIKTALIRTRDISDQTFCRTYDLSEDMGRTFITMEYVPGENLKSTIRSAGPLNISRTLAIAKQICAGLAAAHRLGIVHGDLKPQNILLTQLGIVRIMNLEISRAFIARGITADGVMIGTPGYVSPEQAKGGKVDARSDIYSLGAILFEMVTGKAPVDGETASSLLPERKPGPPPDPGAVGPHQSKGMSRIILKCLEKDRDKRYAGVESLCADLEREEEEIRPADDIPVEVPEEPLRVEPKIRPSAVAGISLAVLAALIGGYLLFGRAKKAPGGETDMSMAAVSETARSKSNPLGDGSPRAGFVEIDSLPPDATIVLNGKPEGKTPLKKEMPPGRYEIQVANPPGYSEVFDVFVLKEGEKFSKSYSLMPVFILEIITVPAGAEILIDGVRQGKTPREITIAKSTCRMELRGGRNVPALAEFLNLKPGRNTIRRALGQARFGVKIQTIPPGASVTIGNEAAAVSPVTKTMGPGRYDVKIEQEGFRSVQETLTVEADVDKTYELARLLPGRVRFNVYPYANVFIDEKLVGEVPPVETMELAEGKYTLKFVSAGLDKTLTVELEIRSEENLEVRVNMVSGESKILKF